MYINIHTDPHTDDAPKVFRFYANSFSLNLETVNIKSFFPANRFSENLTSLGLFNVQVNEERGDVVRDLAVRVGQPTVPALLR